MDESRIAAVCSQDTGAFGGRERDESVTPVERRDGSERKRIAMVDAGASNPKWPLADREVVRRRKSRINSEMPAHASATPSNKTGIARVLLLNASAKLDSEFEDNMRMRNEEDDMPYAPVAVTSPTITRVLARGT